MPKSRDTEILERSEGTNQADGSQVQPVFGRFSRRSFLTQLGAASLAATTAPLAHAAATQTPAVDTSAVPGAVPVTLKINGQTRHLTIESRVTLLDALRENLQLAGTKKG